MGEALKYYRAYKELKVEVPGELYGSMGPDKLTVSISKYQNTGSTNPTHATPIDETQSTKALSIWKEFCHTSYDPKRPWLHFLADDMFNSLSADSSGSYAADFYNVFHGKGSVAAITMVLKLKAWQYRPDAAGKPKWSNRTEAEKYLQDFVDAKIGLDCNGFVTNCANQISNLKLPPSKVANTSTLAFTQKARLKMSTLKVEPYDVISYMQFVAHDNPKTPAVDETKKDVFDQDISHVCMIDAVLDKKPDSATVTIVESASHFGPRYSGDTSETITLKDTGKTGMVNGGRVFALTRKPLPGWSLSQNPVYVYVSAPYLS